MILPKILPGAEHLIAYHVVTEGRCFANIIGEEPVAVEAGEVIVFTKGDPHVMSSSPGMRADPGAARALDDAVPAASCRSSSAMAATADRPSAKLVCGFLACDAQPFNPLLDNLPPIIKAGRPARRRSRLARPVHPRGDDANRPTSAPAAKACSPS